MANRLQPIRDPHAALIAARDLISSPERWTRSASGRRWKAPQKREPGAWVPTQATNPSASRWCAAGALCVVSGIRSSPPGMAYLQAASHELFGVGIGPANDDARLTTHADILLCYDLAIAMANTSREDRVQFTA
jgi:hypothetical protein